MEQSVVGRRLGYIVLTGLVVVGLVGCVRWMNLVPPREVNHEWNVVSTARDRRSIVIRVNECGGSYAGMKVGRVGHDVRITVYERPSPGKVSCVMFGKMPTHIVKLGVPLRPGSRVLGGCPNNDCGR